MHQRVWDPLYWQTYALSLVQLLHGVTNVQRVPDKVQGDAGLEFFTTSNCMYQCYAPQDDNVAKASEGMKRKATADLGKLQINRTFLAEMFEGKKFERWILLCPFVDDKKVINHTRAQGRKIAKLALPFIATNFEALVHCQEDFKVQIEQLKALPIAPHVDLPAPTPEILAAHMKTPLSETMRAKLGRAFPESNEQQISRRTEVHTLNHIKRSNMLDFLRQQHPMLWERAISTISSEEERLEAVGASGPGPSDQLRNSLDRIEDGLKRDVPTLASSTVNQIANGTLADWLMRCPLDFPEAR